MKKSQGNLTQHRFSFYLEVTALGWTDKLIKMTGYGNKATPIPQHFSKKIDDFEAQEGEDGSLFTKDREVLAKMTELQQTIQSGIENDSLAKEAYTKSIDALSTSKDAKEKSDDTQTQLNAVIKRATDSDAMSAQAAVDAKGVTKPTLKKRLDDDYNEVTSQLAESMKKTDVLSMVNMGQDVKEAMTGGSVAVVGVNSVLKENIVNKQITPEKTSFIDVDSVILYDHTKAIKGYLNGTTGAFISGGTSYTSDFIPISLDKDYATNVYGTAVPNVYMYTSDKNYIGFFQINKVSFKIASANYPTCYFIKLTFPSDKYQQGMLVEGTVLPGNYTPYSRYSLSITDEKLIKAYKDLFVANPLDPKATTFMDVNISVNLLDNSLRIVGTVKSTDGTINTTGSAGTSAETSDYIPVQEGHFYSHDCTWSIGFYDINKVFISGYDTPQNTPVITIPVGSGIAFVRISGAKSQKIFHFVEGSSVAEEELKIKTTKYAEDLLRQLVSIPYFNAITTRALRKEITNKLRWEGKEANFLGDSITWGYGLSPTGDNYTKTVMELLGLRKANNYGVSATTITKQESKTNSFVERYSTMSTTSNLNVIFGGINDYRGGIPLGVISDTVNTTFYGALKILLNGVITNNHGAQVVIITPLHDNSDAFNINYRNAAGYYLRDYVQAIKDVAAIYAVPVLDLYNTSGICEATKTIWTQEGLHPNKAGAVKIGTQIAGFLKTL